MGRHNDKSVQKLRDALAGYESTEHELPGIHREEHRFVFIKQVLDSINRVKYVSVIEKKQICPDRANPHSNLFDPIKAALIQKHAGNIDEACWLIFLFVHFGKHNSSGYKLISDVYGRLKEAHYWTWERVSANPELFRDWLREHQKSLKGPRRGFGNHRKYQSLDADKIAGTGEAIVSYVSWVMQNGAHMQLIQNALEKSGDVPQKAFRFLYNEMDRVVSFGRTAKFDYLTMLGKAGLADIEPDSAYLGTATGPKTGAWLMLEGCRTGKLSVGELEDRLAILARYLEVNMQVMEDSLCNWQKSPDKYKLFSG